MQNEKKTTNITSDTKKVELTPEVSITNKITKSTNNINGIKVMPAKLDRISIPNTNVKYGIVFDSKLGSVIYNGKRYDSNNCSKEVPLQCDSRTIDILVRTGNFKKVEIK